MTSALITVAPKLEKLIPLLGSDRPETRTLKQAGADWHDLVAGSALSPKQVPVLDRCILKFITEVRR